ncbi:MAG TPA: RNA polymerase sigma factor [Alphaproteobacteria bacterium]|nr:RNA polymerase sigma factor [Alphaproteobacteria bacterium]
MGNLRRAAKNGRQKRDNELFTHVKGLRRYAMARVGDPADADDLVQETLKRALTYARDGARIENLRAYLFAVLRNVRTDGLLRQQRSVPTVPIAESALQVASPARQITHVECRELVAALRRLPDEQREAISLVALEGLSYQRAAEIAGVPVGTIMSRLFRGREQLRQLMSDEASADEN